MLWYRGVESFVTISAIAVFNAMTIPSAIELNIVACIPLVHRPKNVSLVISTPTWELALFALQSSDPPLVFVLRSCDNLNNVACSET